MKSCGKRFHDEVGKFRFLNELIKVVSPKVGPAGILLEGTPSGGKEVMLGGHLVWVSGELSPAPGRFLLQEAGGQPALMQPPLVRLLSSSVSLEQAFAAFLPGFVCAQEPPSALTL